MIVLALFALWSAYAVRRQVILYGWSWRRVPLVAFVNLTLCPVCMVVAVIKGK